MRRLAFPLPPASSVDVPSFRGGTVVFSAGHGLGECPDADHELGWLYAEQLRQRYGHRLRVRDAVALGIAEVEEALSWLAETKCKQCGGSGTVWTGTTSTPKVVAGVPVVTTAGGYRPCECGGQTDGE